VCAPNRESSFFNEGKIYEKTGKTRHSLIAEEEVEVVEASVFFSYYMPRL